MIDANELLRARHRSPYCQFILNQVPLSLRVTKVDQVDVWVKEQVAHRPAYRSPGIGQDHSINRHNPLLPAGHTGPVTKPNRCGWLSLAARLTYKVTTQPKQIRCFLDRNWLLVIGYWANYQLPITNYRFTTPLPR
jgi:hypothetical protein